MILRSIICTLLISVSAMATVPASMERATRQVIIKWRHLPARLDAADLLPEYAAQTEDLNAALPVTERTEQGLERISVLTATSREAAENMVSELQGDARIEYAEMRPYRHTDEFRPVKPASSGRGGGSLDGVPNDPLYSEQWALPAVEAESAWNITRGDTSVIIAVVDVGVDFSHPDLAAQRWVNRGEIPGNGIDDDGNGFVDDVFGYDFVDNDGDPTPNPRNADNRHGTHVAGIIAATRNNGIGISGLAPGCKVMGVRVGQADGVSFGYDGIYYAARSGARIINCSWGGPGESGIEKDVLGYVASHNAVLVASAGNESSQLEIFPAAMEGVLSVAATGLGDRAALFTSFGPWVKVAAPGMAILSTVIGPNGEHAYAYLYGTSMASPMAAACCGLVASAYPVLNGRQVMDRVMYSCDSIDDMNLALRGQLGFGRINAWRALADSVSGVRFVGVTFTPNGGDGDNHINSGERANLIISIVNDLGDAGNILGHVSNPNRVISILNANADYGDVQHGGPFTNSNLVTIQVPPAATRGPIVPLTIDFLGANGALVGRGTTKVYLDSTFVVPDNGTQKLGFAENGSLGYYDYPDTQYVGPGWTVSDHTNALFHGSFYVAADGAVSDNFYNNVTDTLHPDFFDWRADTFAWAAPSGRADYEGHARFQDSGAPDLTRLFARVNASALAWYSPGTSGAMVLEYRVENPTVNPWNQAYAGFFLDIDLQSSITNVAHYDPQSQITYVEQTRPFNPMVGIVPLTDPLGSMVVIDNRAVLDPPTWRDSVKWRLISSGIGGTPTTPMDLSLEVGMGPVTIGSHSTRTFAYGFLVGQTIDELRAAADSARQRYAPGSVPPHAPFEAPTVAAQAKLFPNPLPQGESLHLQLPNAEMTDVKFFNVLGQMVAEVRGLKGPAQAITLNRTVLNGASGLLFYRIESPSVHNAGKLLILR